MLDAQLFPGRIADDDLKPRLPPTENLGKGREQVQVLGWSKCREDLGVHWRVAQIERQSCLDQRSDLLIGVYTMQRMTCGNGGRGIKQRPCGAHRGASSQMVATSLGDILRRRIGNARKPLQVRIRRRQHVGGFHR